MKKLKSDGNILDRLSELPDSLILEILSLVDIRDVVRTTILSKRWKNLWITTPCLKFFDLKGDVVQIRNFVDRTLTHWRGTHLREFSISFGINSEPEASSLSMDMALWVQFATERKVEDLCIYYYLGGPKYCPPQCLYECSTIRKLTLYDCNLQIRGNLNWNRLNTLDMFDCVFSEDVMNQVFSSSPQLQTLRVTYYDLFQNLSIRSSSLKKLSIHYINYDPSMLTIWAPNLQVLRYSGTHFIKCLLIDISSLIEVQLDFFLCHLDLLSRRAAVKEALRQILPLIQHVVTVKLSSTCFQGLKDIKGNDSFSPLLNVKLLTIDFGGSSELIDIVGLLECFPKLKMLIINLMPGREFKFDAEKYTESEANILKSNSLQLRTVVITTLFVYEALFFEFTGFLLKHASMIEKMVIRRKGARLSRKELFKQKKKLKSLQRSFPSVELILSKDLD